MDNGFQESKSDFLGTVLKSAEVFQARNGGSLDYSGVAGGN